MTKEYDASSIKVLKGLEAVKKRPGMYIGDTDDGSGLHHMVYEVVDNSIDESLAGHCDDIIVELLESGAVRIKDNGRGIPVDIHAEEKVSAAEVIMTQLHAGGKFDQNTYKVSGGLHGVGVSVVNALSSKLELRIWRNNKEYFMEFADGAPLFPLKEVGLSNGEKGTEITFVPSTEIFSNVTFVASTLENRFRELAFLNSGVKISFIDSRNEEKEKKTFFFTGGTIEFVKYLDRNKVALFNPPILINGQKDLVSFEIALEWNDSYAENVLCFTNNIPQKDGGTHLAAFRSAMTRIIGGLFQDKKDKIVGEDVREGLTGVISLKMPDPKFSSQTKDKLVSSEVRSIIENLTALKLEEWFLEHPHETKKIKEKIQEAAVAREAAKKAREVTRRKSELHSTTLPGKLFDCREKDPSKSELFLVEGKSAGGGVKGGRNSLFQAVLPLRGKILNVEKSRLDKVLNTEEIRCLVTTIGAGIGADFNVEKARYHKIVIMTDADVDGSHIRTLLLTLFFRYMKPLVEAGYIYIARPPLFSVRKGSSKVYLQDQSALDNNLLNLIASSFTIKNELDQTWHGKDLFHFCNVANKVVNNLKELAKRFDFRNLFLLEALLLKEFGQQLLDYIDFVKEKGECFIREGNLIWKVDNIESVYNFLDLVNDPNWITAQNLFTSLGVEGLLFSVQQGGNIYLANGIRELLDLLMKQVTRGLEIKRYKGLGEMNDDELWETTLDPEARSLLQVTIKDVQEADDLFAILMGEVVEPRKDFIQKNALDVKNLDV